jgi:hypothetical protein
MLRVAVTVALVAGCWTSARSPAPPAPPPPPAKREATETYDQSTPRAALRSFLRAVEAERYDVVLRFVPNRYRETMTVAKVREQFLGTHAETTQDIVRRLRENVNAPIQETGDRAEMPYGDRHVVQFTREDGVWRLKDLD